MQFVNLQLNYFLISQFNQLKKLYKKVVNISHLAFKEGKHIFLTHYKKVNKTNISTLYDEVENQAKMPKKFVQEYF